MSVLTLEVGGVRIALILGEQSPATLKQIRRRYGSFRTRHPPHFILDVRRTKRSARDRTPSISLKGSVLRCTAAPFQWDINLATGRGRADWNQNERDLDSILRTLYASLLPRHDGLILHAAAFSWKGEAHVFVGRSGAGKTTLARHLDSIPGLKRLSDELVVLERHASGFRVASSPFWGEFALPRNNASAPLGTLFFLANEPETPSVSPGITPTSATEAQRILLKCWVCFERTPEVFDRSWAIILEAAVRHPKAKVRWDRRQNSLELANSLWAQRSPDGESRQTSLHETRMDFIPMSHAIAHPATRPSALSRHRATP